MITAIIPAHDEAHRVEHAVAALHGQTRPPERILVMSDDSTDDTVEVALDAGAEVLLTVDNRRHRAGALNQALATVPMEPEDLVLLLDPGVRLPPGFLDRALDAFRDRNVGAVPAEPAAVGGAAALVRRQALEDVRRSFGRYCEEGPVSGQLRLALDLEVVGWRLGPPVEVEEAAPAPVEQGAPAPVGHIVPVPSAPVPAGIVRAEPAAA